jgi:hypothetical protein
MDPRNKTSLILLIVVVVLGLVLVVEAGGSDKSHLSARRMACFANLKQATQAGLLYSEDHSGRMPLCMSWMDATKEYIKHEESFKCPQVDEPKPGEYGHAMDVKASGLCLNGVKNLPEVVYLFDSVLLARNACSGFYGFPDPKKRTTVFAYLDGHAKKRRP